MKFTGRMYDLDDSEEDAIDAMPDFMKKDDADLEAAAPDAPDAQDAPDAVDAPDAPETDDGDDKE